MAEDKFEQAVIDKLKSEADLLAMISDLAVTDDSKAIIASAKQLFGGKDE